ncbi:inorganic phosphate cotransporter [Nephila pilipes]|uniref:Inorganic phosphate cotransporter n=1 Tax=Nephila pilipes TaxID=299642 RepID=A0A8X6MPZ8_NEPPI|nr:inorganic phosphate cotransporter [Nephila pilipes]
MMPSFSVLMGKWVPPTERARFMSVISSGIPIGGFFTITISGILCNSPVFGWEYVFYVFGVVALIWCILWTILIYDSPLNHPYITKRELNRIMSLRTQRAPIIVSNKNLLMSSFLNVCGSNDDKKLNALTTYPRRYPFWFGCEEYCKDRTSFLPIESSIRSCYSRSTDFLYYWVEKPSPKGGAKNIKPWIFDGNVFAHHIEKSFVCPVIGEPF